MKKQVSHNVLELLIDLKNLIYNESRFKVHYKNTNVDKRQKLLESSKLASLENEVLGCSKCQLSKTRSNTVFGQGNDNCKLMIIGEAPGYEEDKQGLPFVGKAGQLLDKMLCSIDIKREEVYICNIIKCRPPNNRNPIEEEIQTCSPYLNQQIEMINPKIILTLGNFATQFILNVKTGISKLRGKTYNLDNRIILPTFHPSALLQNPQLKRPAWHDLKYLKLLMQKMN